MACKKLLPQNAHFCQECQELFALLPKEGHCSKCHSEISHIKGTCRPCREVSHPFRELRTCFDSYGPAKSLLSAFYHERSNHLAKSIASYLVIQIHNLDYPTFDLLTLVPKSFSTPFSLVVKHLSKLLNIPYIPTLKRHLAPEPVFSLKKKCNIINKVVLLLDHEMQDRTEIRLAGRALKEGLPETQYGLTFCATLS